MRLFPTLRPTATALAAALASTLLAHSALAQSAPVAPVATAAGPLGKADLEALTNGKRWTFRRADGMLINLDFRSGGVVYGRPANFPQSDTGAYNVNERNQLCIDWRMMRSDSGCFSIERTADARLRAMSASSPGQVVAEIVIE